MYEEHDIGQGSLRIIVDGCFSAVVIGRFLSIVCKEIGVFLIDSVLFMLVLAPAFPCVFFPHVSYPFKRGLPGGGAASGQLAKGVSRARSASITARCWPAFYYTFTN